jgi:hypothetical protein
MLIVPFFVSNRTPIRTVSRAHVRSTAVRKSAWKLQPTTNELIARAIIKANHQMLQLSRYLLRFPLISDIYVQYFRQPFSLSQTNEPSIRGLEHFRWNGTQVRTPKRLDTFEQEA